MLEALFGNSDASVAGLSITAVLAIFFLLGMPLPRLVWAYARTGHSDVKGIRDLDQA